MGYNLIFIFLSVILCLFIVHRLRENKLGEILCVILQIVFVVVMSLIFLEVKNIVYFILFIVISFLARWFLKNAFYSKKKIRITKR